MKAKDILVDSRFWTQGALARSAGGRACDPEDSDTARRWCVLGALMRAYGDTVGLVDATEAVGRAIQIDDGYDRNGQDVEDVYDRLDRLVQEWNDDPHRTFQEVRKALEIADV
jgi:hypothetical protein